MLPNYIKAQRRMTEILYKQNKFPEALEYASSLCSLESDKANNFLQRAEILIALQRFEPACKDLNRAKELGSEAAVPLAQKYCK
jgi:predicted Zn-dependent protease